MNFSAIRAKKLPLLFLLTCIWTAAALLIHPIGDFPLNDDFSFGRTVYNLTEQGMWQFDTWLSMTLIAQVLWGALFTEVAGFSFTALRISTLLAGLACLISCFYLIGKMTGRLKFALFTTLLLGFNPLFLSLSYTFMTDVPFLTCVVLACCMFYNAWDDGKYRWIVAGALAGMAATFVRQLGLLMPLAFAVSWLVCKKPGVRNFLTATMPLMVTLLTYWLYLQWFERTQGLPQTFGTIGKLFNRVSQDGFLWSCWQRTGVLLMYLGAFLLPLSVLQLRRPAGRRQWMAISICSVVALAAIWPAWEQTPWGNILYNLGLGPKTLKDGAYFINVHPVLNGHWMDIFRIIASAGAIMLIINAVVSIFEIMKEHRLRRGVLLFFLVNVAGYTGFLMLDVYFFDRYFLPLVFFVLILLAGTGSYSAGAGRFSQVRKATAIVLLTVIALFSVTATHDYLSWNRARWRALDHLTGKMQIKPGMIDGGFEFNGWHRPGPLEHGRSKSWWWVDRDDYVVSFGDLPGYRKERAYPYTTLLPPGQDSIFVLKRLE